MKRILISNTVIWILVSLGITICLVVTISVTITFICYLKNKREEEDREGIYAPDRLTKLSKVKHDNFIVRDGDIEAQVIKVNLSERLKEMKRRKEGRGMSNFRRSGLKGVNNSELDGFDRDSNAGEENELQMKLDEISRFEDNEDVALSDVKFISNNSVNRRVMELERVEVSLIW